MNKLKTLAKDWKEEAAGWDGSADEFAIDHAQEEAAHASGWAEALEFCATALDAVTPTVIEGRRPTRRQILDHRKGDPRGVARFLYTNGGYMRGIVYVAEFRLSASGNLMIRKQALSRYETALPDGWHDEAVDGEIWRPIDATGEGLGVDGG